MQSRPVPDKPDTSQQSAENLINNTSSTNEEPLNLNPQAAAFRPATHTHSPLNAPSKGTYTDNNFIPRSIPSASSQLPPPPSGKSPSSSSSNRGSSSFKNANFLLNFNTTTRDRTNPASTSSSSTNNATSTTGRYNNNRRHHHHSSSLPPTPFDRTTFLQANFRFLISDAVDTKTYASNPDLMFDWDDVVQVDVPIVLEKGGDGERGVLLLTCPISLDRPLCPQITPCGHVFDFAPLMGHLVMHGGRDLKRSAPCPLCFSKIAARELRMVNILPVEKVDVGQELSLTLLKRRKESILAEKVSNEKSSSSLCSKFSKFTTTNNPMPLLLAEAERLAKYAACVSHEGGLDAAFEAPNAFTALESLASRAKAWVERRQRMVVQRRAESKEIMGLGIDTFTTTTGGEGIQEEEVTVVVSPQEAGEAASAAIKAVIASAAATVGMDRDAREAQVALDREFPSLSLSISQENKPPMPPTSPSSSSEEKGVGQSSLLSTTPPPPPPPPPPSPSPPTTQQQDEHYYYYQSSDGQSIFLHSLNIRMLVAQYQHQQHQSSETTAAAAAAATSNISRLYDSLPGRIKAKVLELEELVLTEVGRKKSKVVVGHLPLQVTYKLVELDMTGTVSDKVMAGFAEELSAREKRRAQRAKQEERIAVKEAKMAAAAAAVEGKRASTGPSAAELKAMPALSVSSSAVSLHPSHDDGDASVALEEDKNNNSEGEVVVSFAKIAKLGFAATGPALGESPPLVRRPTGGGGGNLDTTTTTSVWGGGGVNPSVSRQGPSAWGNVPTTTSSNSSICDPATAALKSGATTGGKKSGKHTLLFTTSQRRY